MPMVGVCPSSFLRPFNHLRYLFILTLCNWGGVYLQAKKCASTVRKLPRVVWSVAERALQGVGWIGAGPYDVA